MRSRPPTHIDRMRGQLAFMFGDRVARRLHVRMVTAPDRNPERRWFRVSTDTGVVFCSCWGDGYGTSVETFQELPTRTYRWWSRRPRQLSAAATLETLGLTAHGDLVT